MSTVSLPGQVITEEEMRSQPKVMSPLSDTDSYTTATYTSGYTSGAPGTVHDSDR